MAEAGPRILKQFKDIDDKLKKAYEVANEARKKGFDPEYSVDIPLAKNMAERVEGLISAVAPQIVNSGVSKRIQELEKKYGSQAWEVALKIAEEVSQERFCKFKDRHEAMEVGIRTGFAYHTVGVVAAPLEGLIDLKVKKRLDGRSYIAARYAGPIRGAGGTAAAFSVILVDYIRKLMGYSAYDPSENEVNRFIAELRDYHERITNLQYNPDEEEIRFLVSNIPVEIDGDPTEKFEVSNYKDLPRVETNRLRGGVSLVVSMIALKAPKLWKELQRLKGEFGLEWDFLKKFLEIQKLKKSAQAGSSQSIKGGLSPDYTFIADLVAGRPVLTYPLRTGGFRLRYGRSRTSGYSASSISPATMAVLEKYIATGTQLKMERPGKATVVTACDTIEGPIVKTSDGSVFRIDNEAIVKQLGEIKEILFLGDILISYGDFFDRAHPLVPAGYCEEWHILELEQAIVDMFGSLDLDKASNLLGVKKEELENFLAKPLVIKPTAKTAIEISRAFNVPLHPRHTYYWSTITAGQLAELVEWLSRGEFRKGDAGVEKIVVRRGEPKRILELLGVPHLFVNNEFVVIERDESLILSEVLGLEGDYTKIIGEAQNNSELNGLEILKNFSPVKLRDKAGTFIGCRMGRPEKAKIRKLTGSPQALFPIGEEGGRLRCFQAAVEKGTITADFPLNFCEKCEKETIYKVCETCSSATKRRFFCPSCGKMMAEKNCPQHGEAQPFKKRIISAKHYFDAAKQLLQENTYPDLIKGVRGTSNKEHIPEHLFKGFLRAKHNIYVNKDGTTRYDMTEVPITHFRPREIRTSVEKLRELGYDADIHGNQLENEDQVIELMPQDVILPSSRESTDESADAVLFRLSKFIDELLVKLYSSKPFYNFESKSDLVGTLVIGIAPHISAGIVGRIIGFSKTQAFFAHPLYHAAMRRDADGDEASVILLMDALLNFSRQYLPDSRGSRTMDAPLVLTSTLVPSEVDDMAHRLDTAWNYPLELYSGALEYKLPWEIKIAQLGNFLGTEKQYEGVGYTHETNNINSGVLCSAYKTLPSMEEKLIGQMVLAERIRAVDTSNVAALVIEKHFMKDIRGNLRKFSSQQFRCVNCNEKYRRPPLTGRCYSCNSRIIFTISEGSVIKYLEPAISIADKYDVSPYLKQTLKLTKQMIEEVFGREETRQEGLGKWFG